MAEEASRERNSVETVKRGFISRRNSLPLFSSDFGKDVPCYLRASTGSCHDHCKYGKREAAEVKQHQPVIKRSVVAAKFKAPDKAKPVQHESSKIPKPTILSDYKTPEVSCKQSAPRKNDIKALEGIPKSVKSKLLKETPATRKLVSTSGNDKLKRQKEIVPVSGSLSDSKTNSQGIEGGKLIISARGSSSNASVKHNAKEKPSSIPTPSKIAPRIKPLPPPSPHRARPVVKTRANSSSPTKLKTVSLKANFSSSPGSLKLKRATVKTSPPSVPPRDMPSKKTITTRSQIVQKGKITKDRAIEVVAIPEVVANSENKALFEKMDEDSSHEIELKDQEATESNKICENIEKDLRHETELKDQEATESKELCENNEEDLSHETELKDQEATENGELLEKIDEDLSHESALNGHELTDNIDSYKNNDEDLSHETKLQIQEVTESRELYENVDEDSSHETELQNQEAAESYVGEISEKTLYVIKMETENKIQPPINAEDEILALQPLTSLSSPQSPSSPVNIVMSNISTLHETSLNESSNLDTSLPYANQETPDIQPLPSLSPAMSPKSQSSIVASNVLSHLEVSQDCSVYTESDEGYSSYEDDQIIEGENENPKGSTNSKLKKSVRVISQEGSGDPVKLRFRRGRVIDITDEHQGPRRLKFRRAKVLDEKTAKEFVRRNSFKKTEPTQVKSTTNGNNSGSVVLRHQDIEEKDAQGLYNNVIEETASKLVGTRKSMVKALVGAFETVISLQDGKPETTKHQQ